jgi:serine/threonine protein kinase
MEYLPGGSLGELIARRGRLPEAEALRIITQVGQALHHAHQQGLIHRDVKPDNILLTENGEAKLTDLGLMKVLDHDMNLTQPEACVGTPNFIPPEQFDDAKHADPRCDVYSLAATLYMAITGVCPFDAKAVMAILRKKMLNDIVPPQELVPSLTPRVRFAICRAILADPKKRFGSCEEFLLALNGGVPAPSTTPGVPKERRAEPRYPANLKCSCRPASSKEGPVPAVIQDISASGVRLLADRAFEVGTMLVVRLEGARPPMPAVMVVKVIWTAPDPSGRCILGCASDTVLRDAELRAMRSLTASPVGEFPSKARSHA